MRLDPGKPVDTKEPTLEVDGLLTPGSHRFQLVVTNEKGQASVPDEVVVEVRPDTSRPL